MMAPYGGTRLECLRMEGRETHVSLGPVSIYIGERLAMRGTAIGREARRMDPYGSGRAGPDREHVRREPFSDDPSPQTPHAACFDSAPRYAPCSCCQPPCGATNTLSTGVNAVGGSPNIWRQVCVKWAASVLNAGTSKRARSCRRCLAEKPSHATGNFWQHTKVGESTCIECKQANT